MDGKARTQLLHLWFDDPEAAQELAGGVQRAGRGRIEPRQLPGIESRGAQVEQHAGEIEPFDLGRMMIGPRFEVVPAVEPQRASRLRAARAAGALFGGSAADFRDRKIRQPRPRRVRRDAREAGIDHGRHAGDGHARLGNVGAQNDFSSGGR